MNGIDFRTWLMIEAGIGPVTDPYEALQILGLGNYTGKSITKSILDSAYREVARKTHPDMGGNKEDFQKTAASFEILQRFADSGQTLPSSPGQTRTHTDFGSGFGTTRPAPNVPLRHRPENAPMYTVQEINDWAQQIASKGFFQVIQKEKKSTLGAMGDWKYPIGSKKKTWKLSKFNDDNPEGIVRTIKSIIAETQQEDNDILNWHTKIIAMQIYDQYAFLNFIYPLSEDDLDTNKRVAAQMSRVFRREHPANTFGYCTIEFNAPPKPKQKGLGMKPNAVSEYLANNGLRWISGGGRNNYYGLSAHMQGRTPLGYVVKLQPAAFKCIRRWRYTGGYKPEIKETDILVKPYGQLTTEILDKVINWVKSMYEKHGLGDDKN
jgi:hypothetical protein